MTVIDPEPELGGAVQSSAANRSIGSTTGCTITEKAPTRAFSWLKAVVGAFSVIVQPVVEPMDRFAALLWTNQRRAPAGPMTAHLARKPRTGSMWLAKRIQRKLHLSCSSVVAPQLWVIVPAPEARCLGQCPYIKCEKPDLKGGLQNLNLNACIC